MENTKNVRNKGEDSRGKDDANSGDKEKHDKQHARKISGMEDDAGRTYEVMSPQHQYRHHRYNSPSRTYHAYGSPSSEHHRYEREYHPHHEAATHYNDSEEGRRVAASSAMPFQPSEEKGRVVHRQFLTPQERRCEGYAVVTPSKSSLRPPSDSTSAKHSAHPYHQRPYVAQALSSPSDDVKVSASSKDYNQSSLIHQQHPNDRFDHYTRFEQGRYHEPPNHPQPKRGEAMPMVSAPYRREISSKPHFTYTFDRHGALTTSDEPQHSFHSRYDEDDHAAMASSPHQRDSYYPLSHSYHGPRRDHWLYAKPLSVPSDDRSHPQYSRQIAYYEDGSGENKTHPLLRDYNPDNDSRHAAYPPRDVDRSSSSKGYSSLTLPSDSTGGTDHQASFQMMIEDPTVTPPMPEAASEVDFNVMRPPLIPITQSSKDTVADALTSYDVLLGRGGGTNNQVGNRHFRSLVRDFQPLYLSMKRKDKPLMARSLVLITRKRGGRFLQKDEVSNKFYEVGDEKAEAKASQALREGLKIRALTKKRKQMTEQTKRIESERQKKARYNQRDDEERQSPSRTFSRGHHREGSSTSGYYRAGPDEMYHYDRYENPHYSQQRPGVARYESPWVEEERRIRGGGGEEEYILSQQNMQPMVDNGYSFLTPMHPYQQFHYHHSSSSQELDGLHAAPSSSLSAAAKEHGRANVLLGNGDGQQDENDPNTKNDAKIHVVPA